MRRFPLFFATALSTLGTGARAADISAWFAPGTLKIMRNTTPAAAAQTWELTAARNEVEACQLVLASDEPVQGLTVALSQPQDVKENGGLKLSLFRVEYVPAKREKIPFPDPLPPLTGPIDLQAHQTQPIWISVRVPNLHIDMDAMSHRTLPWQQKREGFQGLLYWQTTYWEKKFIQDPWQEMDTIGTGYYGDGSLLYPGNKVGVNGPVTSVRLEVLRDGLKDYDYLALTDRWLGPDATPGYVAKIVRGLTDFEHDPLKLESVRRELGAALEKAAAAPCRS